MSKTIPLEAVDREGFRLSRGRTETGTAPSIGNPLE
jgi:hypothetical protein